MKEYVAVHFWYQATVAARTIQVLKAPVIVKLDCPVGMYWTDKGQTHKTKINIILAPQRITNQKWKTGSISLWLTVF